MDDESMHSDMSDEIEGMEMEMNSDADLEMNLEEEELLESEDSGSDWEGSSQSMDSEKEKIVENSINLELVPDVVKEYWKNPSNFKKFKLPPPKQVPKSVCAKIISKKEKIIECFDCRVDSSCIICLECFKNGNHEGHKYIVKTAFGGCCDCGDKQAWSEKGFCCHHTGQFVDFQIENKICQQFNSIFDGLFFQYFRLSLKGSKDTKYFPELIKNLIKLNENNPYYNKLTAICLQRKLVEPYILPSNLNNHSILQNILSFHISGKLIHEWFNFFTIMFPYYPFKMALLAHYISNFGLLVDGSDDSIQCASSISCQIITSHKLIEEYALNNKTGIGQNTVLPKSSKKLKNFYFMMLHDFESICKLSGDAPLLYWKMHFKSGIGNVFSFQDFLRKQIKTKMSQFNMVEKIVKNIDFVPIENRLIDLMGHLVKILPLKQLNKLIHFLWHKCSSLIKTDPSEIVIFRPEERTLAIALFKYFNLNLSEITPESIEKLVKKTLKTTQTQFQAVTAGILTRMMNTYLHYAKCMAESGYSQSLYPYLYYYKIKNRMMASLDILCIKILLLFSSQSYSLDFSNIIQFPHDKITENQDNEEITKQKKVYFDNCMSLLHYLYISNTSQIFWTYQIDPTSTLYQQDMESLLVKAFKTKGGEISNQFLTQIKASLFHHNAKFIDECIRKKCRIVKERKTIQMDNIPQNIQTLNFFDFWTNIEKSDKFQSPMKTIELFSHINSQIYHKIWNQISVKSCKKMLDVLYKNQNTPGADDMIKKVISTFCIAKYCNNKNCQSMLFEVIQKYERIVPAQVKKMLQIQGMEEKSQNQALAEEKKKILQEKRLSKLKKFAKKKASYFEKMGSEEKMKEVEDKDCPACCICRNDNPQQLVYLTSVEVRNHQKLLRVGQGVQCLSFTSCHHTFDYKCVEKIFKANKIVNSISCPLCKNKANLLLPLNTDNLELSKKCMDRIIQILFSLQPNSSLYQQLFKCFYHYILLCMINFEKTFRKRKKIYEAIYNLIFNNIIQEQIQELENNLTNNKIHVNFKNQLSEGQNPNNNGILFNIMQLLHHDMAGEDINFTQINNLITLPSMKKNNDKEKEKKEKEGENIFQPYSHLFRDTIREILNRIKCQKFESIQSQESINPFIKECIQSVVNSNYQMGEMCFESCIGEKKIFRKLPSKYSELGIIKKCCQCGEYAIELMACLMCEWTGCQKCERGTVSNHMAQKHGKLCAVINIQKGEAYYISNNVMISSGCLYQDQFGNPLILSKEWDQFELNEFKFLEIQRNVLNDEIPSNSKK